VRIVAGVVAVLSVSLAAGAQAQEPPPFGGFNTSVCHGRAATRLSNGPLIVRKRGDKVGLYRVNPDGSALRRLTHPPKGFEDDNPAASPDGRQISFVRGRFGGGGPTIVRVMVLDLATRRAREIFPTASDAFHTGKTRANFFSPTWSPDGRWIAISDRELPGTVLVHPEGTGAKALDTGPWRFTEVSWSPNGRCLAGQAAFKPEGEPLFRPSAWGIVGADGGQPNVFFPRCPSALGCIRAPDVWVTRWTRDGRALIDALGTGDPRKQKIEALHVVRTNLSGTSSRVIGRHMNFPVLSPDGRLLTAWSGNGSRVLTVSGRRVRRLARMGVLAWAPKP
jgi:hypothetical protein